MHDLLTFMYLLYPSWISSGQRALRWYCWHDRAFGLALFATVLEVDLGLLLTGQ